MRYVTFLAIMLVSGTVIRSFAADAQSQDKSTSDVPVATAENWPLFRADAQGTGVARSELPAKLELLWKYTVDNGAFESTAAIVDGVAYIGDLDGKLYA